MTAKDTHLSAFVVDALVSGALTSVEREAAERHLEGCTRCSDDVAAVRALHEKFTADVLPRTLPNVRARVASSRRPAMVRWIGVGVAGLAAAAAIALVLHFKAPPAKPDVPEEPYLAIKGSAGMKIVAQHAGTQLEVVDGVKLAKGDAIRFVVDPNGLPYLLVASVDGDGQVTVYFPAGGKESGRVEDGRKVELPGSIVLDDARGPERVFALFSKEPLAAGPVTTALLAIGAGGRDEILRARTLPVPAEAQRSIVFDKVSP
ncbi:MAG: DUF4384 domain-containing protein [Polyangiaceae bacterium]|nr:DUF4384 domain-containing protein [Polyangiaceae bacterium]